MEIVFFTAQSQFREWLKANHANKLEQWVGFYKISSQKPSITWPESVDEALCFGWIDGLRKSIDEESYKIRFTPRRPRSHWSAVNIKRVAELKAMRLMMPIGLEAFSKRDVNKSARAAHEQKTVELDPIYESKFKKNRDAWGFWIAKAPGYRKQASWWILSAKREETRMKRLNILIDCSAKGDIIPPLKWVKKT